MIMNPVIVSVALLTVICLLKFNILVAILISAVVAGIMAGMTLNETMQTLIGGMAGMNQVALSYILLGALAYGIHSSGLAQKFAGILERIFGNTGKVFVICLALVASLSQNVIPVHIAFIPILIPPLLSMMNKLQIDRRGAACALTFGLKAPYILIPAGFGLIFHNILFNNMADNGMGMTLEEIWPAMVFPAAGMAVGLLIAVFITYRKPRVYETAVQDVVVDTEGFTIRQFGALLGAVAAFGVQIYFQGRYGGAAGWSLPLGAVLGILIMLATKAIDYKKFDDTMKQGVMMMGGIAFIMLVASGYAAVIRDTGGVDMLVDVTMGMVGDNRLMAVIAMQLIGLMITMGIGTSFGTVPIIAAVFVPICLALGMSPAATVALVASAAATGDAGTPASDSTLGPTAGLAVDGQHDHIWDTCVPTFLHFNIPIMIMGTVAAMVL